MDEIAELRRRIDILEAREAVREAMCRYSRAQIRAFLHGNESQDGLRLSHFGHNAEVSVSSADPGSASAIFKLEDWVTLSGVTIMKGFGQYRMQFRRGDDGIWRISRLRLLHDYREEFPRYIDGRRVSTTPALDQS